MELDINYEEFAACAESLITEAGRTITLVRPSETPSDPDKPWEGNTTTETTLVVPAVQLLPNQVRIFGLSAIGESGKLDGLIQVSEIIYIVFQGEADLRQFTFVRDGGVQYHIEGTQALKPANTTLLGYIGVRR